MFAYVVLHRLVEYTPILVPVFSEHRRVEGCIMVDEDMARMWRVKGIALSIKSVKKALADGNFLLYGIDTELSDEKLACIYRVAAWRLRENIVVEMVSARQKNERARIEGITVDATDLINAVAELAEAMIRYEKLGDSEKASLEDVVLAVEAQRGYVVQINPYTSLYEMIVGPAFPCPFGEDCATTSVRIRVAAIGKVDVFQARTCLGRYEDMDVYAIVETKKAAHANVSLGLPPALPAVRFLIPARLLVDSTDSSEKKHFTASFAIKVALVKDARMCDDEGKNREAARVLADFILSMARGLNEAIAQKVLETL